MRKTIKYEIDKTEIEELISKMVGKRLIMVEPQAYDKFSFEEAE